MGSSVAIMQHYHFAAVSSLRTHKLIQTPLFLLLPNVKLPQTTLRSPLSTRKWQHMKIRRKKKRKKKKNQYVRNRHRANSWLAVPLCVLFFLLGSICLSRSWIIVVFSTRPSPFQKIFFYTSLVSLANRKPEKRKKKKNKNISAESGQQREQRSNYKYWVKYRACNIHYFVQNFFPFFFHSNWKKREKKVEIPTMRPNESHTKLIRSHEFALVCISTYEKKKNKIEYCFPTMSKSIWFSCACSSK